MAATECHRLTAPALGGVSRPLAAAAAMEIPPCVRIILCSAIGMRTTCTHVVRNGFAPPRPAVEPDSKCGGHSHERATSTCRAARSESCGRRRRRSSAITCCASTRQPPHALRPRRFRRLHRGLREPHGRHGRHRLCLFRRGKLRAAAELKKLGDTWGREAEAAFSVEQPLQEHGIGTELMGRVIRAARNRGVQHLCISCLADNDKMRAIARHYEADLRFEYGEVVGEIVPAGRRITFPARRGRRRPLRLHDGGARSAQSRRQSGVTHTREAPHHFVRDCVRHARVRSNREMRNESMRKKAQCHSKHDKNDDFSQHIAIECACVSFQFAISCQQNDRTCT